MAAGETLDLKRAAKEAFCSVALIWPGDAAQRSEESQAMLTISRRVRLIIVRVN